MTDKHTSQRILEILQRRVRLGRFGINLVARKVPSIAKDEVLSFKQADSSLENPTYNYIHERAIRSGGGDPKEFFSDILLGDYRSMIPFLFRVELDRFIDDQGISELEAMDLNRFMFQDDTPWQVRDFVFNYPELGPKETACRILHVLRKPDWDDVSWIEDLRPEKKRSRFRIKGGIGKDLAKLTGQLEYRLVMTQWGHEIMFEDEPVFGRRNPTS